MKKHELKTGMQVETRDLQRWIVLLQTQRGNICQSVDGNRWWAIGSHANDLTYLDNSLDIMKVFDFCVGKNITQIADRPFLIWERPVEKMITIDGKKISESTIKEALREYLPK